MMAARTGKTRVCRGVDFEIDEAGSYSSLVVARMPAGIIEMRLIGGVVYADCPYAGLIYRWRVGYDHDVACVVAPLDCREAPGDYVAAPGIFH